MTERTKPRSYTDEFKQQLVQLHQNGKRKCDICNKFICLEYDIATSLLDKWLKQFQNSGSFHEKGNRSPEQQELLELRKRNRQLEMENDILKQAALTKERKFLDERQDNLAAEIREIFRQSRNNYGTRKIKTELCKEGQTISRRHIGRIMKQEGLISTYTVAQYRPHVDKCNESKVQNIVNRDFSGQPQYNVAVSDLTYVRVEANWNYICVLVDLFNRGIIGDSAGKNKDAGLVEKAFSRVNVNLEKIQIFDTDRGNEFKNRLLEKTLAAFHIQRSLSMKSCPYDNAVAEATYKIIKTDFYKVRSMKLWNSCSMNYRIM